MEYARTFFNMKPSKFIIIAVLAIAIILGLAFARVNFKQAPRAIPKQFKAAATIFPIYDIAKNIAGDKAEVASILPHGASPHTFEPNPSDIFALKDASLIFVIGHGLDDWITRLANSSLQSARIVMLDKNIVLQKSTFENENEKDGADPHYWLSAVNAQIIANTITDAFISEDPNNAQYYSENKEQYLIKLKALDTSINQILSTLETRSIIAFHDSWGYFGKEYGVDIVGVFEPFPGKEPTPRFLKDLQDTAKKYKLKAVFTEPQLASAATDPFVNDLGLNIFTLDPLGGTGERMSYSFLMLYNACVLSQALNNERSDYCY